MPKVDIAAAPVREDSSYRAHFNVPCMSRVRKRLGLGGGLADFGVNMTSLPPGCWSSQRHWHSHEDQFVYLLEGELVVVEDAGETVHDYKSRHGPGLVPAISVAGSYSGNPPARRPMANLVRSPCRQ
jgi:hypothetical protein